jgi:hypothetical protein
MHSGGITLDVNLCISLTTGRLVFKLIGSVPL